MSESSEIMADTVHERVGKAEQEIHTLKHQVTKLEQLPPRVSELERAFEVISYIRQDLAETKTLVRETNQQGVKMSGDIEGFSRALKWVGAGLSMAAIVTAAVVWVIVQ